MLKIRAQRFRSFSVALSVKRTLADSGPLVAYVGCCGQNAHSAVLQGVSTLSLGTLVANSELAVCSGASKAGGLAFATVLGPLVTTWMTGDGRAAEFATSVPRDKFHTGAEGPPARKRTVAACTQCCGSRWALQQTPDPAWPQGDKIGRDASIARSVIPRVRPPVCCVQYAGRSGDIAAIPPCIP